jgi:hypothetical protein
MPAIGSAIRPPDQRTWPQPTRDDSSASAAGSGSRPEAEVPGAAQDARRDVEQTATLRVTRLGVVEQRRGLGVDLDAARVARARVDPGEQAVGAIARVLLFEPLDLAARARGPRARSRGEAAWIWSAHGHPIALKRKFASAIRSAPTIRPCTGCRRRVPDSRRRPIRARDPASLT